VLGGDKSAKHRGTEGTERNTRGRTERKRDFSRAIRWLTHTGREVSPSGLKSKQPDLCGRSTTFASLRPCVFAFFSSKQPGSLREIYYRTAGSLREIHY
jgi:hypothetical protein